MAEVRVCVIDADDTVAWEGVVEVPNADASNLTQADCEYAIREAASSLDTGI